MAMGAIIPWRVEANHARTQITYRLRLHADDRGGRLHAAEALVAHELIHSRVARCSCGPNGKRAVKVEHEEMAVREQARSAKKDTNVLWTLIRGGNIKLQQEAWRRQGGTLASSTSMAGALHART